MGTEPITEPAVVEEPRPATAEPATEPAWRIRRYGPLVVVHDSRCWLDPRHHCATPCSWPRSKTSR